MRDEILALHVDLELRAAHVLVLVADLKFNKGRYNINISFCWLPKLPRVLQEYLRKYVCNALDIKLQYKHI
jgi:hypothetical protein